MSNNVTMTMQAIFTQRYTMQLHPQKTEAKDGLVIITAHFEGNPPQSSRILSMDKKILVVSFSQRNENRNL